VSHFTRRPLFQNIPDIFTKAKRSAVMAAIRGSGNKDTELRMMALLRAHGIKGWRRQIRMRIADTGNRKAEGGNRNRAERDSLPNAARRGAAAAASKGKARCAAAGSLRSPHSAFRISPVSVDFVFRRERVALFVDGCYWHACPKHGTMPAGNRAFWKAKLARNTERDRTVTRALRKAGWTVLRIWEHDLAPKHWPRVARRVARALAA
jgi:DNA mismatch endonuclease (patch repair protein)